MRSSRSPAGHPCGRMASKPRARLVGERPWDLLQGAADPRPLPRHPAVLLVSGRRGGTRRGTGRRLPPARRSAPASAGLRPPQPRSGAPRLRRRSVGLGNRLHGRLRTGHPSQERIATRGNPWAGEIPAGDAAPLGTRSPCCQRAGSGQERMLRSCSAGEPGPWNPSLAPNYLQAPPVTPQLTLPRGGAAPGTHGLTRFWFTGFLPLTFPSPPPHPTPDPSYEVQDTPLALRMRGSAQLDKGAPQAKVSRRSDSTTRKGPVFCVGRSAKQGQLGHSEHRGEGTPAAFPGKCGWLWLLSCSTHTGVAGAGFASPQGLQCSRPTLGSSGGAGIRATIAEHWSPVLPFSSISAAALGSHVKLYGRCPHVWTHIFPFRPPKGCNPHPPRRRGLAWLRGSPNNRVVPG